MNKIFIFLIVAMITSCDNQNTNVKQEQDVVQNKNIQKDEQEEVFSDGHNAENSLDWAGVYEGVLPCADCDGIKTTLTLSIEGDFELKQVYEKNDENFEAQTLKGKFEWDKNGSIIHIPNPDGTNTFFVGEGYIVVYDTEGEPIESDLNYTLRQIEVFN